MPMKNPPHVGGLIRREVIEPLGLTVTEAAKVLHVGRQALSALLNEKAALTSEMALCVEKAFGPRWSILCGCSLPTTWPGPATRRSRSPSSATLRRKERTLSLPALRENISHSWVAIYQQKLAALQELKKSLLHKAFSGAF